MTLIAGRRSVRSALVCLEPLDRVSERERLRKERERREATWVDVDDRPRGRVDEQMSHRVEART